VLINWDCTRSRNLARREYALNSNDQQEGGARGLAARRSGSGVAVNSSGWTMSA
jgi:hypothetical protein